MSSRPEVGDLGITESHGLAAGDEVMLPWRSPCWERVVRCRCTGWNWGAGRFTGVHPGDCCGVGTDGGPASGREVGIRKGGMVGTGRRL